MPKTLLAFMPSRSGEIGPEDFYGCCSDWTRQPLIVPDLPVRVRPVRQTGVCRRRSRARSTHRRRSREFAFLANDHQASGVSLPHDSFQCEPPLRREAPSSIRLDGRSGKRDVLSAGTIPDGHRVSDQRAAYACPVCRRSACLATSLLGLKVARPKISAK
jgi:hypothetical protein